MGKIATQPVPGVSDLVRIGGDRTVAQQVNAVLNSLLLRVQQLEAQVQANTQLNGVLAPGGVVPVISPFGLQQVDLLGVSVFVGQMVRVRQGRVEIPSFTDIGTVGGATGIVVEVANDARTAVVARGAAVAPMRVQSPVVGSEVLLFTGGVGTCSASDLTATSASAETQVVGICDSATLDANGCVRVLSVSFGGGYEYADLNGLFIRMAYDNTAPNRTGLINTLLEGTTGAPFGTLFYIRNLGGIGANGLLVEMPNGGTGNGIVTTVTGSMIGVNAESVTGAAGSFLNNSASAFSLVCGNNDASLRHASFGSELFIVGDTICFHSFDTSTGAIFLTAETPAGDSRTLTLIDASGPIPQLGLALATASGAALN